MEKTKNQEVSVDTTANKLVKNVNAFLNNDEAAEHLDIEPNTLCVWRCTRRYHIPYFKIGRKVRYRLEDLDAWLASRVVVDITAAS